MRWALVVLWLAVGGAVWNGFYDLYVSRGAREYLQLAAEAELRRHADPSMTVVMDAAKRDGLYAATAWSALIVVAGWSTGLLARRTPRNDSQ